MKQWIQIWYSWGDREDPVEVPDGEDAWKYALHLAVEEAAVSQEMCEGEVGLRFDENFGKITLRYADDTLCHYLITDNEEFFTD